jgi:hypothetical protein
VWRGEGGAADILRWFRILLMSAELGVETDIVPLPAVPQTLYNIIYKR